MKPNYFIFFILSLLVTSSCTHNPLNVNVDEVSLDLKFINLDSIFVHTETKKLASTILNSGILENEILAYELGQCLGVGPLSDSGTVDRIKLFVNDPFVKRVENRIAEKFADNSKKKEEIRTGFKHLKYHFPQAVFPKNIVFINSHFASNVFCTQQEVGVSLERYLGAETDVIKELPDPIFQWIKDKMDAQYLTRDVLTAWIMTHFIPEAKGNTAEQLIYWGKIIYLTEAAFPDMPKNIIMRYSVEDLVWANKNEYSFWQYLVKEKMLFSENEREQMNFLSDAPFTVGLPEKGPDRLGQFIGWKMVQSFMKANPKMSLADMVQVPYNQILQEYEIK
jgi:hypothetical protein